VVHGIINNAGVSLSSTVVNMSYEDLEWVMNINFWGVIHGTKAFLPKILSAGEGSVVNVSSIFGIVGIPSQSAYNAAKFAVRGFTEALRQELLGTGVYALSVHPGGIKTNIVNNGRHKEDASGRPVTTEKLGRQFDKMAPTTPSKAAQIIVRAMLQERGRVLVGTDAVWIDRMQRTFPEDYAAVTRRFAQMQGNRK
jgi:short-subunit dehydrogenase